MGQRQEGPVARQSPRSVTPRKPPTDRRTGESNTGRGQLPIDHAIGPTTARSPLLPAGGGPGPQRVCRPRTEAALQTSHIDTAFSLPHPSWGPGAQLCPPACRPSQATCWPHRRSPLPCCLGVQWEGAVREPREDRGRPGACPCWAMTGNP